LVISWPFWALAQDKPADNMQLVLEKIRADKKVFIGVNMQLSESEAENFWPIYNEYQNELFLLRARTVKLINDYAKVYNNMTDYDAKNLLDAYITIETLRPQLIKAYLPKFRKVLPEIKAFRYYQLENKINAALMYELARKIPLIKDAE
jgi:hypothetical protein